MSGNYQGTQYAKDKSKQTVRQKLLQLKLRDGEAIIGVREAELIHTADDGTHPLTQTTDFINSGDWITLQANSARILLTNSTGSTVNLTSVSLRGKPVTMLTGSEGMLHDAFANYDDIEKYGEKTFEFGNEDIVEKTQLEKLCDYWWKYHKTAKHIYSVTFTGTWHFLEQGDWATLQIGAAGQAENIDSTVEVFNVRMTRAPGELGETVVILREVEEAWKNDSSAVARFIASGGTSRIYNNKLTRNIASQYYSDTADAYCNGTNDEVVINEQISQVSASGLGGTVHLTAGTYNIGAAIDMKAGIILDGEGPVTIIKKNANDYAIHSDGASGSELSNIEIRDMQITRDSGDTNSTPLILLDYTDDSKITNVFFNDPYDDAVELTNCDGVTMTGSTVDSAGGKSLYATACTKLIMSGWNVTNSTGTCVHVLSTSADVQITGCVFDTIADTDSVNGVIGVYQGTQYSVTNNVIRNLSAGDAAIYNTSTDGVVSGNLIESCTINGSGHVLYISGARCICSNNIIKDTLFNGQSAATNSVITCTGSNGVIEGNLIVDVERSTTSFAAWPLNGIYVTADDVRVAVNDISDLDILTGNNTGAVTGILFASTAERCAVDGNNIRDINNASAVGGLSNGIYQTLATEAYCTINNNVITSVDDFGIFVNGDRNVISGNNVTACDTGIELHTTADRNQVTGNVLMGNTTDAIDDNGTNNDSTANMIA